MTARTPWHHTPEAAALIASCIASPPPERRRLASLSKCFAVGTEVFELVFDPNDDRVDALARMANAAFLAEEARVGTKAAFDKHESAEAVLRAAVARARMGEAA